MSRRKRVVLSLKDKLNIIDSLRTGATGRKLADKYGVGTSTISDIKKNTDLILSFTCKLDSEDGRCEHRKIMRKPKNALLEDALYRWFLQKRSTRQPISGPLLCEKALQLNKKLGGDESFVASNGWLCRFRSRHGIRELEIQDEDDEDEEDDEDSPESSTESGTRSANRDNVEKSTQDVSDQQLHLKRTEYKCNECDKDIFGYRYACVQCAEWDVCAACEARGAHALHYVLRVPADKPHLDAKTILEKIRQIINIEKRENQDVPLDELESIKCEVDSSSDPLNAENVVKIEIKVEPLEISEFEYAPLTVEEATIEGNTQLAEPKKVQQRRKRKAPSATHTVTSPDKLPDTQVRMSSDRVTEVTAKRNTTQSSRDPVAAPSYSQTMNDPTAPSYDAPADTRPDANARMTLDRVPGSVVPVVMYNIPKCEDGGELQPEEMLTSATSSSRALLVSSDPLQPAEHLVIKTELPE